MALLDQIQAHIIANTTAFKQGASTGALIPIWLDRFPTDTPNTAVALFQYGGSSPQFLLNSTTPTFTRPSVQVISRSTSYSTAEAHARTIYNVLAATKNTPYPLSPGSTSTVTFLRVIPNQEPFPMGRDGNRREQFSCNYLIEKELA